MGKGFRKFKRKMRLGAVVRSILLALSVETVIVAAQWLYAKQVMLEPDFLRYALVGAVPALVGFTVTFILLWPRNKRLARRLDNALGLDEKTQTMIAFRGDESAMAVLQREDAEAKLAAIPRRRAHGACTWLFVALPLMAVLSMVGTILVPAKEPPTPPPTVETGWKLDVFMEQKLKDLITYVETSDMEEEPRHGVVGELDGLLIKLRSIRKESVMRAAVVETIVHIHEIVSEHNTYDLLADALVNTLSEDVRKLGNSIYTLKPLLINEQLIAMKRTLLPEDAIKAVAEEGKGTTAQHMAVAINQALSLSEVSTSNEVYAALSAFAAALETVTDETENATVEAIFAEAETTINQSLEPQILNESVGSYAINRLMEIFGIPKTEIPPEVLEKTYNATTEDDYKPNDDDKDHNEAGGLGSGEVLFGSNDTIYDPDKGTYTAYGEVLTRYYATVLEHIGDGSLPEELEDMFYDYFAMLHNGSGQKDQD